MPVEIVEIVARAVTQFGIKVCDPKKCAAFGLNQVAQSDPKIKASAKTILAGVKGHGGKVKFPETIKFVSLEKKIIFVRLCFFRETTKKSIEEEYKKVGKIKPIRAPRGQALDGDSGADEPELVCFLIFLVKRVWNFPNTFSLFLLFVFFRNHLLEWEKQNKNQSLLH